VITISINPDGEITLSQESAGEHKVMHEVYAEVDPTTVNLSAGTAIINGVEISAETQKDEMKEAFFKQGWEAATREAMHAFVAGRLVEYFQEIGMAGPLNEAGQASQDPHHNEPAGTGEAYWEGRDEVVDRIEGDAPVIEVVADDPEIKPVTDSGEPELEAKTSGGDLFSNGTWTMSDEELQSRMDETYNRGRRDGELASKPIQTTERTIRMMAVEVNSKLWPEGYGDLSKREVLSQFGIELAKRMGIEVSA